MALDGADRQWVPDHARRPGTWVLHVTAQQVVGGQLLTGRPRVREAALRQDPLVDAGIGVGDVLLRERAAGAASADRVAQLAVLLNQAFLGHDQRLGLRDDVAVVAGVVERRRHDREAASERRGRAAADAGDRVAGRARRAARLVLDAAAGAVRDQELVVPAGLRRPCGPGLR